MPEIKQIPHLQAINHITDQALLFVLKNNTGLNMTHKYKANDKQYKINIQIREVTR